jgi:hypothetical protein
MKYALLIPALFCVSLAHAEPGVLACSRHGITEKGKVFDAASDYLEAFKRVQSEVDPSKLEVPKHEPVRRGDVEVGSYSGLAKYDDQPFLTRMWMRSQGGSSGGTYRVTKTKRRPETTEEYQERKESAERQYKEIDGRYLDDVKRHKQTQAENHADLTAAEAALRTADRIWNLNYLGTHGVTVQQFAEFIRSQANPLDLKDFDFVYEQTKTSHCEVDQDALRRWNESNDALNRIGARTGIRIP